MQKIISIGHLRELIAGLPDDKQIDCMYADEVPSPSSAEPLFVSDHDEDEDEDEDE